MLQNIDFRTNPSYSGSTKDLYNELLTHISTFKIVSSKSTASGVKTLLEIVDIRVFIFGIRVCTTDTSFVNCEEASGTGSITYSHFIISFITYHPVFTSANNISYH